MNYLIILSFIILSYLFGSIPTGYLLAKLVKNIDVREHGSKNTGATNTTRVLGFKFGALTALLDVIKGMVVMALLFYIKELEPFYLIQIKNQTINILALYGAFAVIGHVFPIFLKFKGGKAVATSFGVVTFLTPMVAIISLIFFVISVIITKYVSLTSLISALVILILTFMFYIFEINFLSEVILEFVITYAILVAIVFIRHKDNIKRLLKGEENKFLTKK